MFRWLLVPLLAASAWGQIYEGRVLVEAKLIADTTAVVPGKPFQVGLLLEQAPHWHTYWQYAGDAGIPTSIAWTLPEGFGAGPIEWPLPERLLEPGDIVVYAYSGKVLLLTTIVPPATFGEKSVTLRAKADWLVCEEICIPGGASVELTLPVADTASPANEEIFREFHERLPQADPPPYELSWKREGKSLNLTVGGLQGVKAVDFFPLPSPGQIVGHPAAGPVENGAAVISLQAPGDLRGVFVAETDSGRKSWFVSSGETAAANPQSAIRNPQSPTSLWFALLSGFLGGLILNLMPCVLPVISLKIFGFIRQAGEEPGRIFRHGLAFSAGIFAWFLGLAAVIAALRAAGSEVTWAFQFQNPWFIFGIACVVFVFALNLFGVFEIILPGRASNALAEASAGSGYGGSFSQGLFATLLATPCTAPFLGTALGFAFSQPVYVIFAMFGAVSLGMASPYLLLSARPGWMKILPKPGAWMERVKQFMGFPLLATLIWLFDVLAGQKGTEAVIWTSAFLLCLALACWIYGTFCGPLSTVRTRVVALIVIVFVLVAGGWTFLGLFAEASREASAKEEFTRAGLEKALASGQTVFVDFTADWCLSCKVNERVALANPAVQEAFRKDDVLFLKADWTNANPDITAILKEFGRVGVPFYLLYPAGRRDQPIILPEVLTPQIVLDALARAR